MYSYKGKNRDAYRYSGAAILSSFFRLIIRGIHMILLYGGSKYFPINAIMETIIETNMGVGVDTYIHLSYSFSRFYTMLGEKICSTLWSVTIPCFNVLRMLFNLRPPKSKIKLVLFYQCIHYLYLLLQLYIICNTYWIKTIKWIQTTDATWKETVRKMTIWC